MNEQLNETDKPLEINTRRIIRWDEVMKIVGLSKSSIERLIARNEFPAPVRLSHRAIGFHLHELTSWIDSLPRIDK